MRKSRRWPAISASPLPIEGKYCYFEGYMLLIIEGTFSDWENIDSPYISISDKLNYEKSCRDDLWVA